MSNKKTALKSSLINQLKFNTSYLQKLVKDVDSEQFAYSPSQGLENHPAFTIGHCITGLIYCLKALDHPTTFSEVHKSLFLRNGPGDPKIAPTGAHHYPEKSILVDELQSISQLLMQKIAECSDQILEEPYTWKYANYFPTKVDFILFMVTTHFAMHNGQLAAWRRAVSLPSALAEM